MYIGKPDRVDLLAKELKEHGIACSLDEAEEKAKSMMMHAENKKEEPDGKIQLLEQRYKFLLNSQNQKFSEEIDNIKNTLSSISSDLIELKRQISEQNQAINQCQKPKVEVQQKITNVEKQKATADSKEEKRIENGELNPEDFSVEKFFYCGQK